MLAAKVRQTGKPATVGEDKHVLSCAEGAYDAASHGAALRKTKHRGLARVASDFLLNIIACNLIRIPKLIAA